MAVPRWQAEQGQTVRLRVRFEQNGAVYDPLTISQVEIIDPSSVVQDTLLAGWIHESTGVYYLDWPVPLAAQLGGWSDRWTYTPHAGYDPRTGTQTFAVFAVGAFDALDGYLSAAQLRSMGFIDAASPLTDAQLDYLSGLCTSFFENAAGQVFTAMTRTIDVSGSGRLDQPLPPAYVIRSLSSITNLDDGAVVPVTDLRWRVNRLFHKDWRPSGWRDGGDLPPWLGSCGGVFPSGYRNIRVVGSFGRYESPPALVVHAVGLMVKAAGAEDATTSPWIANYANESVDGQGVVYALSDTPERYRVMTGIPEVDRIINQYRFMPARFESLSG